jgi:hypothetical protein
MSWLADDAGAAAGGTLLPHAAKRIAEALTMTMR